MTDSDVLQWCSGLRRLPNEGKKRRGFKSHLEIHFYIEVCLIPAGVWLSENQLSSSLLRPTHFLKCVLEMVILAIFKNF